MEHDNDMDPLRNLEKYQSLLLEYKNKPVNDGVEEPEITMQAAEALISEVSMKKMAGGTYEIPCTINGLPLKFVFDTGASNVTISSVEASFMLKNDYLSERDFRGSKKFIMADGSITDGAIVCIKEVLVGDVLLKNIEASVVKNQKAPLLLGQSVLERFGSITIDNENNQLIIKH
jgi:clan AA aspartic protease (TIGR02281 family)